MKMHRTDGLVALAWMLAFFPIVASADGDWSQWRGLNRAGKSVTSLENVSGFRLLWKQEVAGPCHAGPSVSGNTVIVPDHGDGHDYVKAFDLADGRLLWTFAETNGHEMDFNAGPRAAPLIWEDKVYMQDAVGSVYGLDLASGRMLWRHRSSSAPPEWGWCGSPMIADGKLLLNSGDHAGPIAAFDPVTGKPVWKSCEDAPPNYCNFITGTFGGVAQAVGYDMTSAGGWALNSGKRLWRIPLDKRDEWMVTTPVAVNGQLALVSPSQGLRLFGFEDHGIIRTNALEANDSIFTELSTPVAVDGLIIGAGESIVCLDAENGLEPLWSLEDDDLYGEVVIITTPSNRFIAFCDGYAAMVEYDRNGARKVFGKPVCQETYAHPALARGRLIVRDDETVYCYALIVDK